MRVGVLVWDPGGGILVCGEYVESTTGRE